MRIFLIVLVLLIIGCDKGKSWELVKTGELKTVYYIGGGVGGIHGTFLYFSDGSTFITNESLSGDIPMGKIELYRCTTCFWKQWKIIKK
jgi:hypothetical protein